MNGSPMLRSLLFAIKIGIFVAAAILVVQYPGSIEVKWQNYRANVHTGVVIFTVLFALAFVLFLHRVYLFLTNIPQALKDRRTRKQNLLGWRSLTRGLSAVAAGDIEAADKQAQKARQYLPKDQGLSLLLEAQAARLKGHEDEAAALFRKLTDNKDTAFLGVRGMLVNALERGDQAQALTLARQGLDMHPRQGWIIKMVYDLELSARDWDHAERTLRRAERYNAIDKEAARNDRVAMLVAQADEASDKGDNVTALKYLKQAQALDEGFTPVAERLARIYWSRNNKRGAIAAIEKAWRTQPHTDLLPLWEKLAPDNEIKNSGKRMKWYERLVALNPESDESQMAAAGEAINQALWGEARQYLKMAEQIRPSTRLYRLWSLAEDKQGHEDSARSYLEKAENAPIDKVWACQESGQVFERWIPVTPQGHFNTIIWGYPGVRRASAMQQLMPQNELMMLAK